MKEGLSQQRFIFYVALCFTLFYNYSFFRNSIEVYSLTGINALYIASLWVMLLFLINFLLTIFSSRYTTKPLIVFLMLVSSVVAYFTTTYNVFIDDGMIRNALQTDMAESLDLLSPKLALYFLFLGVIPSYIVYKTPIRYKSFKAEATAKIKSALLSLAVIAAIIFSFSKFYTSFFREHLPLRCHTNPPCWTYSLVYMLVDTLTARERSLKPIGRDAHIEDNRTKKLLFMVVGEATRADHLDLNGYARETMPKVAKEDIVNFSEFYSCGTSTAYSVPCMFSVLDRDDFSYEDAYYTENVLDVLRHTGKVAIVWRDNNSDSKGVALRVAYENYKTSDTNPICDEECRDIGMLVGLEEFIAQNDDKDILIVLHQMGNHGPAYYKRYTKEYARYTPVCTTNQLEECKQESIVNAYDNALLYSDNFLAETIAFAKKYDDRASGVFYISDHGESLGENGIYLHGLPYFVAPDAQKHVGAFIWLNGRYADIVDREKIEQKRDSALSHDNLFHSLLGLFEVKTSVYDSTLDITK